MEKTYVNNAIIIIEAFNASVGRRSDVMIWLK